MAVARRIRVLLVDDHTLVRQGLRSALEAYSNIDVVGEAGDGEEAVERVAKLQPAVVVMDINMSKMDGIAATRVIKTQHPEIGVVGLSANAKDYYLDAMQQAGAFEVLMKDSAVDTLYAAIQRAVAAVQPVLILEEMPTPKQAPVDSEQFDKPAEKPASTGPCSMKEQKV
jgi:DNA-binding NarL/FixJ family response regulator